MVSLAYTDNIVRMTAESIEAFETIDFEGSVSTACPEGGQQPATGALAAPWIIAAESRCVY
jgi:hypothetical protein